LRHHRSNAGLRQSRGREDIEFVAGMDEVLSKVLFGLSTPEITEVLTHELARRIIDERRPPGTVV
jgi:hypothetical protein